MASRPMLTRTNPVSQLVILIGLVLISMAVATFVGIVAAVAIFDLDLFSNPDLLQDYSNPEVINSLKIIQLFNSFGMFLVPPIALVWLTVWRKSSFLSINISPNLLAMIFVVILMLAALPFINFLAELNASLHLPDFLSGIENWMKDSETNAAGITEAFLEMNSTGDLLFTLLLVAVIPAIGEELLFRGALQRIFVSIFPNPHVAIWVTGAIFSAIHFQFFGFFPRMILGAFFGYLLWWSGSLWLPILAHFVNNGTAVMISWYQQQNAQSIKDRGLLPPDLDTIGSSSDDWLLVAGSLLVAGGLSFLIYRNRNAHYMNAVLQKDGEDQFAFEDELISSDN